jgi:DNA-binding LacI/PurR family transcriptional regulator
MSTIFDVAREAGVSITTVSRALNGYSDVSEKTRQRIIEVARSIDYYPSAAARNLQSKRTDTVAIAPMLREHVESEQFFKEFLGLLTLSAFRHNLSLLATIADTPSDTNKIYRELARSRRVDGILLADVKPQDERIDLLRSLDIPYVAFGRTSDYMEAPYPLADVDSQAGIETVVAYLVAKGHRRIAYLSGPFDTSYSLHRYSGYREGLKKHGLPFDERLVIANLQEHTDTIQAVDTLLLHGEELRPTAIVTTSDYLALQVIRELQDRGTKVGSSEGSIAVTGFDDLPLAGYIRPSLTTVRQPIAAIADILMDLLAEAMENHADSRKKPPTPDGESASPREQHEKVGKGQSRGPTYQQARADMRVRWIGPNQVLVEPELVVRLSA